MIQQKAPPYHIAIVFFFFFFLFISLLFLFFSPLLFFLFPLSPPFLGVRGPPEVRGPVLEHHEHYGKFGSVYYKNQEIKKIRVILGIFKQK